MSAIDELKAVAFEANSDRIIPLFAVPLSTAIAIVERLERQCESEHVPIATTDMIIDELNDSKQQVATLTAENKRLISEVERLKAKYDYQYALDSQERAALGEPREGRDERNEP